MPEILRQAFGKAAQTRALETLVAGAGDLRGDVLDRESYVNIYQRIQWLRCRLPTAPARLVVQNSSKDIFSNLVPLFPAARYIRKFDLSANTERH